MEIDIEPSLRFRPGAVRLLSWEGRQSDLKKMVAGIGEASNFSKGASCISVAETAGLFTSSALAITKMHFKLENCVLPQRAPESRYYDEKQLPFMSARLYPGHTIGSGQFKSPRPSSEK